MFTFKKPPPPPPPPPHLTVATVVSFLPEPPPPPAPKSCTFMDFAPVGFVHVPDDVNACIIAVPAFAAKSAESPLIVPIVSVEFSNAVALELKSIAWLSDGDVSETE
jgi:hypothetical protein